MIQAITVTNFKGEKMRMELSYPEKTGMMVYEVSGIGAGQADINVAEVATVDGGQFNSARLSTRNITLSIKLMDIPSVEDNRRKTYRFFPLKKKVTLTFETDNGKREISGYTESNDPVIFSSQEYTQISILCPYPYFSDPVATTAVLSGYKSLFTFPFSNESLTEKLLVMDDLKIDRKASVFYQGEADTGMTITIRALNVAKNITLYNTDTLETMHIDTDRFPSIIGNSLKATDYVEISTYVGRRSAQLVRAGVRYNIINSLGRHSDWFSLVAGVNNFAYSADLGEGDLEVSFSYNNLYEGV